MSTFKKAEVILLPTNEVKGDFSKERIYPCLLKHSWMFDKEEKGKLIFANSNIRTPTQLQNLYIISDDEIKENNTHFYNPHSGQLHISGNHTDYIAINKNGCKKIIATTDVSLGLPQPSKQFIQKYIEEYNKGREIKEVLVEYEDIIYNPEKDREYQSNDRINIEDCDKLSRLKINPKDNTITIKKAKDSWTREEVKSLFRHFRTDILPFGQVNDFTLNKWIEENL